MGNDRIALRMDDVFASSKLYEIYGRDDIPFSNFLFLKYLPGIAKWGPYAELSLVAWQAIIELLDKYRARMTVGITATWVEKDGSLVSFYRKFPDEAGKIREGVRKGLIEPANHGLTHCVVGKHLPRLFSSNRSYHREFWDWIPATIQEEHIRRSQEELTSYFSCPIVTFIPPGNVWGKETLGIAARYGLKYVSCFGVDRLVSADIPLQSISEKAVIPFHDREIVMFGVGWLENLIKAQQDNEILSLSEIGAAAGKGNTDA